MTLDPLPIDSVIPAVLTELDEHGACVLTSPPGSGKTTRVPPALVEHGVEGAVWVLQPRRVAVRAALRDHHLRDHSPVPLGRDVPVVYPSLYLAQQVVLGKWCGRIHITETSLLLYITLLKRRVYIIAEYWCSCPQTLGNCKAGGALCM